MAKVSISQAAKLAGIARSHLYEKYIKSGKITVSTGDDDKKFVDTSELLRVFGTLKGLDSGDSSQDREKDRSGHSADEEKDRYGQQLHDSLNLLLEEKDRHIQLLHVQLEEARQREHWLQDQVKTTTKLLEDKRPPTAPAVDPGILENQAVPPEAALETERTRVNALESELAAERSKGFWSRLFGR